MDAERIVSRTSVSIRPRPGRTPVDRGDPSLSAKVVLVRPPILVAQLSITAPTCPPVGVAYLAASLRAAGHDVRVIDAVGEAPDQFVAFGGHRLLAHGLTVREIVARVAPDTEIVGVSCMFSHEWPLSRAVISALRKRCPKALIVVGGEHATALPQVVLDQCPSVDVVVVGEGEATIVDIADSRHDWSTIRNAAGCVTRSGVDGGGVHCSPARTRLVQVDDIPSPAWDLVPVERYLERGHGFGVHRGRSMPIVATRGCPYSCTFCSNPAMWTTKWVARNPKDVLDEICGYLDRYQAENIDFYDLTAIVRKSWIVEFCQLVIASRREFTWQLPSGTRSEALDAEVLQLLWRSGCRNVSYAPESGSPAVLQRIKKRVDLVRMKRSIRDAVRIGINCKANIIVGFPDETHREVWATIRFCAEVALVGLHDLSITPFSPYPGTELFDRLRCAGRVGHLDDSYFLSLASYSDLRRTVSMSAHISDRALGVYAFVGMAVFYGVSFLRRPWRALAVARHVISDTQESRLEMAIVDHMHRRKGARSRRSRRSRWSIR